MFQKLDILYIGSTGEAENKMTERMCSMFQVGDVVVYGSTGVCEVVDIGPLDLPGMSKEREYYTLRPFYEERSRVFTPVDGQKVILRAVLTKKEALELIDQIREIGILTITNEKQRETEYKACFLKCNCTELVKMLNTIHQRKEERLAHGKRPTAKDERYCHMAEENLFGELAVALKIEKGRVKEFIHDRLERHVEAAG